MPRFVASLPLRGAGQTSCGLLRRSARATSANGGGGLSLLVAAARNPTGGSGDDLLIGGEGSDTANFGGSFANYTVSSSGNELIVNDNVGADGAVLGVEKP